MICSGDDPAVGGSVVSTDVQSTVSSISAGRSEAFFSLRGNNSLTLDLLQSNLYGREKESSAIKAAFDRISSVNNQRSEICLLHGTSGSGKTMLVEALRQTVFDNDGFFVLGKSDQVSSSNAPYSALISAFSDLCELIMHSEKAESVKQEIKSELRPADLKILGRFLPSLSYLIELDEDDSVCSDEANNNAQTFTRFKILCRTFLRVVSSFKHPVVLVCDDMQWADTESIDLIEGMTKDDLNHVLIVCLYRDDEELAADNHASELHPMNRLIRTCQNTERVSVTDIHLAGLSLDSINLLVSSTLKLQPPETLELAELLVARTQGNAYFCLHFLKMLESDGLLYPDEETLKYVWSIEAIREQTSAAENVVQIISRSIHSTSPVVKVVLVYAAFLGFRFSKQVLELILDRERQEPERGAILDDYWREVEKDVETLSCTSHSVITRKALEKAATIGFVESIPGNSDSFRFTHDRAQDGFLQCMHAQEERKFLHLRIGRSIRSLIDADQAKAEDWMYFCAALNMNKAISLLDADEKKDLLLLNVEAGRLAASKSAFKRATEFLRQSLELLDDQSWENEYVNCLHIHDMAMKYEYYTGNFDESCRLATTILAQAHCLDDKLKAMRTRVDALLGAGRLNETVDVGLAHITELGVTRCPKKYSTYASVIAEFVRCHMMMRRWTDLDYQRMPIMNNKYLMIASRITISIGLASYMMGDELRPLQVQISLRWCQICATEGLSAAGPMQIVSYGFALALVGKYEQAHRIAMISQQLMDRCNNIGLVGYEHAFIAMTYSLVAHWTWLTLHELKAPFERGFRLGMENADTAYAFNNLNDVAMLEFHLATSGFSRVRDIALEFSKRSVEYQLSNVSPMAHALFESVKYFMGHHAESSDPSFDAIDFGGIDSTNSLVCTHHHAYRLILAYHFDNAEVLKDALDQVEAGLETLKCHFVEPFFLFYIGMAHYVLYSKDGKRRNRNRARRMTSMFEKFERKGLVNRRPLLKVLLLEKAALHGTEKAIQAALVEAVRTCEQQNFVFSKAIAKERGATAMMTRDKNDTAKRLAMLSMEIYESKEMFGKALFLDQKFGLDGRTFR